MAWVDVRTAERQCRSPIPDRNVVTTQIPTLAFQDDPKAYSVLEYEDLSKNQARL